MVASVSAARRGIASGVVAVVGVLAAAAVILAAASPAEAARRKARGGGYSPPFAAIVVDAKTGRTLYARNEDAPRFPASITKVMTLYLLFEQIERGRFRLDSELPVSARAAMQAPSKIGFDPGDTISVEDAIKALITKSANDVAVVVAEAVAGSEEAFARQMTARARSLGMNRTTFRNASGLPDDEQVTTARDLSILARALQDRFPREFAMFQTRVFTYAGVGHRNHNKLLGRVKGVDGIKTGYTRKSGFNLMTSAKRDGRNVVAIVLGGKSGAQRDRTMASLIEGYIDMASAGPRTAPPLAVAARPDAKPRPAVVAEAPRATQTSTVAASQPSQVVLKQNAQDAGKDGGKDQARILPATAQAFAATSTPPAFRWVSGAQTRGVVEEGSAVTSAPLPPAPIAVAPNPASPKPAAGVAVLRSRAGAEQETAIARAPANSEARPDARIDARPQVAARSEPAADVVATGAARSGWIIQIGATDDEDKARALLDRAKTQRRALLSRAAAFTEPVRKGGSTLYRARYSGFDENAAQDACRALRKDGFACFAVKG